MNELQIAVQAVLERERLQLAHSTYVSRKCYFNRLLELAEKMGFDEPCQELFDEFTRDDRGSDERRQQSSRCVRAIDAHSGTRALMRDGRSYNEPVLPDEDEAAAYFSDAAYPVENVDAGMLIVKTKMEMAHVGQSESTVG